MATQQETNRARWFEHIRQCKASSLTQKAYCEQHNLSQVNKYQYYQKLYSKLNKHSSSNSSGKNSFIQIHSPQQKPEHIELKLPNSLVLLFSPDVDASKLKYLVEELRTC